LALPSVVVLPAQFGDLLLKSARKWVPDLPTARDVLVRGLVCWWMGLVALAALSNALQHLRFFSFLKVLPWLVLGGLAVNLLYDLVRGSWAWPDLVAVRETLDREWSLFVALLLGFVPLSIHKRAFPFPLFMRNSFTLANMVYQPVERLLRDGYLTFEPSHKAGSYLLVFIPSALSNVDPLAMAWSLPILQVAAFALGLYLWAFEVSRSRLLATLVPLFGGFVLSAGPLFETTPVIFRSNSVQLVLLPWMLWLLHKYVGRRSQAKGLFWPLSLSAAGVVGAFAVVHSDKLFWPGRLQALYPGEDLVRLLHLYGVGWSARTTAVLGWLALPLVWGVRHLLGRGHLHRDLLLLFALLIAFQFQLHAWEAPIFLGIVWAYLVASYVLSRRSLYPLVYLVVFGLWLFWFVQWTGWVTLSGESPFFSLLFFWVSHTPDTPRVRDLVDVIRNAHALVVLSLWGLGTLGLLALRGKAELLIVLMSTVGLAIYFAPEPNGVRAYKVLIPFVAYALAWIVAQTGRSIPRWSSKVARSLAWVVFAVALVWVIRELMLPFRRYYERSLPGQRYALYLSDDEQLALDWLRKHLPDNARLVSDPHSMHLFSELTNSIDLLEHAMTTTEMSSVGQQQVSEIKQNVFLAETSHAAHQALYGLAKEELSFRNRDYARRWGAEEDPTLLVLISGKTSQWIDRPDIDALFDPVLEAVAPAYLNPFLDLRYFRLRYQIDRHMWIFEARGLRTSQDNTALYWVAQGNERWFTGRQYEAIALYEKALQLDAQESQAHIALGEAYRQLGDWDAAIERFEQASVYAPEDADLYRVLGDLYLAQRRLRDAVDAYTRAIQRDPDNPALHARLGDAYLAQRDLASARQAYAQSARSPYGAAEVLVALGDLYSDKGLSEDAEGAYRDALDIEPELDIAYQGLAGLYRAQGRMNEAADAYKTLIDLDPYQVLWYAELQRIYVEQERSQAAVALYENAIKRYPWEKQFHLALGDLYLSLAKAEGR
jgi:tetratricopeptide (TPR) repeat protein